MREVIGDMMIDSNDNKSFHLTQLNKDMWGNIVDLDEIVLTKEQLLNLKEFIIKEIKYE